MTRVGERPILILGGGINGAALARELAAQRVPVCLVDCGDLASGATAYSSRLIHGGLRYLEYGEFDLVRESLRERTALLRLAPQFVRPLRLFVPVRTRFSGLWSSARRMLGGRFSPGYAPSGASRGLYLVRSGLFLYDNYAQDSTLPRHSVHHTGDAEAAPLDARQFPWQCAFHDAQIAYPERFVLAMLEDGRHLAHDAGQSFEVLLYHRARRRGKAIELIAVPPHPAQVRELPGSGPVGDPVCAIEPAAIVNATGAWVDLTLRDLQVPSKQLIGGTKGSHFLTTSPALRSALGERGIYAEAGDGRPFFILPLCEQVLVGTTDLPFRDNPRDATADPAELDYLLAAVNDVVPQAQLTWADIDWHYSGVRPLPYSNGSTPAAITRRHWLEHHPDTEIPCFSVIGGKLTTCRSLAVETATKVLQSLNRPMLVDTTNLPIAGGFGHPDSAEGLQQTWSQLAGQHRFTVQQVERMWRLCGTRAKEILAEFKDQPRDALDGTQLPIAFARWSLQHEHANCLEDLIERRLMLLYEPSLTRACLQQLAGLMAEANLLSGASPDEAVDAAAARLKQRYGKRVIAS